MSFEINVPFALRLHAFGLRRLMDPAWSGGELYDRLKAYMRRKSHAEPKDLLYKTLDQGVLWLLGCWLFDEFASDEYLREGVSGEARVWHAEDLVEMLSSSGTPREVLAEIQGLLEVVDNCYEEDESAYWGLIVDEEQFVEPLVGVYKAVHESSEDILAAARAAYASNYADRVFHDRELCAYISELTLAIGIDGGIDDGPPVAWVDREYWPAWAKRALMARERGKCAWCGVDFTQELDGDPQIDHIVALARGGTNDLVNLQYYCADCNRRKSANEEPVKSSIPPYISRRLGD